MWLYNLRVGWTDWTFFPCLSVHDILEWISQIRVIWFYNFFFHQESLSTKRFPQTWSNVWKTQHRTNVQVCLRCYLFSHFNSWNIRVFTGLQVQRLKIIPSKWFFFQRTQRIKSNVLSWRLTSPATVSSPLLKFGVPLQT